MSRRSEHARLGNVCAWRSVWWGQLLSRTIKRAPNMYDYGKLHLEGVCDHAVPIRVRVDVRPRGGRGIREADLDRSQRLDRRVRDRRPRVTVGDDAVIGAGSVVLRDVPARSVAAGVLVRGGAAVAAIAVTAHLTHLGH